MKQNKFKKNYKHIKDDTEITPQKPNKKPIFERRSKKLKTLNNQNVDKILKMVKNILNKELYKESNKEAIEKCETDDTSTSQSSTQEKTNEKSLISSHSFKKLIKIDQIKSSIEEDESKNKSDDEYEKIDKKINQNRNKHLELMQEKEEEIRKKDCLNFNYNIKSIFTNKGKIKEEKETDKDKDKDKDKDNNENKEKDKEVFVLSIYKKDHENIRKLYYSQLLLKKVWKPINDSKRHNSLIIFDWDDTLLPTSFLSTRGIFEEKNELNEKDQGKINKLENSVKKLLTIALSKGDVYIITNAGDGWVEFSSEKYYPNIKELLDKIEIISAREKYAEKYPEQSSKWKIEAFLNLKKRLNDDLITNIICVGDSVFEMEAGRILASKFIHAVIKTIKFREKPKPDELNKQLNLVLNQFNSICTSSKNLTVRVERKKKQDEDE